MPPFYRTRQLPVDRNPHATGLFALPKTGLTNQDFLSTLLNSIKNIFGLDLSSPDNFWASIIGAVTKVFLGLEGTEEDLEAWVASLLTPLSPIDAQNLYGRLLPKLFANIPLAAITNTPANLLDNSAFTGAISIDGDIDGVPVWTWDNTVFFSDPAVDPDPTTDGSASVVADGTLKELVSNTSTVATDGQVIPGQPLSLQVQVLTTGLVGTGTPVQLGVETDGGAEILTQIMPNAAPSDRWENAPAGSKAAVLTATYIVPDDGSVTWVGMRLSVDPSATAGTVRFGDAQMSMIGGLIFDLQNDHDRELQARTDLMTAWRAALTTLANDHDWSEFIASFDSAWQDYQSTISGLQQDEVVTFKQLLNDLIPGLFPAGSEIPSGITDLRTESDNARDALSTLIQSWSTTLMTGGQSWSDVVTALDTALATYWTTVKGIQSAQAVTIKQIIGNLLHINPDTGEFDLSQVNGLTTSFNQLGAALSGDVDNAGDWAWLAQIMNKWFGVSQKAHDTGVDNANTLGQRNNQPLIYGLDDTTEANIVFTQATSVIPLKAPNSIIGFVRCYQVDEKNTAAFTAAKAGATSPSGLIVTVYKVDFSTGIMDFVSTTTFTSAQLNQVNEAWFFASAASVGVEPGDVLAVEFQSTDATNVLNLYGALMSKPVHPSAQLPSLAATRNAGTTAPTGNLALSALTFTNANVPYIGFEISNPPAAVFPDYPTAYTTPGVATAMTVDSWAKYVDLIGVGGGGGGQGEMGVSVGRGGSPGQWATKTLQVGVDIAAGATITITVGAGGTGGPYFTSGTNGQPTTFAWTDMHGNPQTFTAPGGQGGGAGNTNNLTIWGQSPGDITYESEPYYGGAGQFQGGTGNPPGGSGPGGQPFQFGFAGARGQAWTVERQS